VRTTRHHTPASHRRPEDGQALAELALVTPILAVLLMAIFQFAFVLQSQMGLTNAVREAARRAAATENPTSGWVQGQLTGPTGLLAENVQGYTDTRLVTGSPSVSFDSYCVAGTYNERITVTVSYRHPVFFPLLGYATDLADGTPDGDWTLTASAQMRLEHASGTCS
jgi:Flp pilus assembly protein TadG